MTNQEVVQALRYCSDGSHIFCNGCPAFDLCDADTDVMFSIAASRMENLLTGIERLQEKNAKLQKLLERMERERDQALKFLGRIDLEFRYCAHNCNQENDDCVRSDFSCSACKADCVCKDCMDGSNWKWRGVE